jgi:signal transduction histidine kinase/ActR/RegA family two-component response regulator
MSASFPAESLTAEAGPRTTDVVDSGRLLEDARERIFTQMILVSFATGMLVIVLALPTFVRTAQMHLFVVYSISVVPFLIAAWGRSLPFGLRAWIYLADLYMIGMVNLWRGGPMVHAGVVMLMAVAFAGFFLSRRSTFVTAVAVALGMAAVGYGYVTHRITPSANEMNLRDPWNWWVVALDITSVTTVLLFCGNSLLLVLARSIEQTRGLIAQKKAEKERVEKALEALRRTEAQLLHARKMEAVGRLAGGIAHDFNNTLTVVLSQAEFLLDEVKHDPALEESVRDIDLAAMQAAELTRQLMLFGRGDEGKARWVEVNEVLQKTGRILRRMMPADISVETSVCDEPCPVMVDEAQFQSAIINLALNARDAMPEGGALTVRIERRAVMVADALPLDPGEYACVVVRDTGVGMDRETRERIFEPFFTTKSAERGTGLGLAMVWSFARRSRGHVTVESDKGRGSAFGLYLPITGESKPPEARKYDTVARAGHERVLVVEDDARIRALVSVALSDAGYTVIDAPNGREAIRALERPGARFDLVCTDLSMPELDGRAVIAWVRENLPGVPVLLCSGNLDDDGVRKMIRDGEIAWLAKPYTGATLVGRVREVLDQHAAEQGRTSEKVQTSS